MPEILVEIGEQNMDKPLVVVPHGPWAGGFKERAERARNVLVFDTAERACTALSCQWRFQNNR